EELHAGTIQYRLLASRPGESQFKRVLTGAGISVLENKASPRGPYFLTDIDDHANFKSSGPVTVLSYAPDAFTLRYVGHATGFVVVPMSFNKDWRITLDGTQVEPVLKEDVMPAVAVSSPATIRFQYRPRVLRWLLPWLAT